MWAEEICEERTPINFIDVVVNSEMRLECLEMAYRRDLACVNRKKGQSQITEDKRRVLEARAEILKNKLRQIEPRLAQLRAR